LAFEITILFRFFIGHQYWANTGLSSGISLILAIGDKRLHKRGL
jgi:hypothetical protein